MKIKMNKTVFLSCALCGMSAMASASVPPTVQDTAYHKYRIGGYGEILTQFKDYGLNRFTGAGNGNARLKHSEISIPRFVLSGDYKLSDKWILGAEIEFESGGVGMAYEIESGSGAENGEYENEIEKGGEVALEQFHITRLIHPAFNVRVGHLIIPLGLTNAHHEPLFFFTPTRPEGERTLLPSTWHETGLEFFGGFGRGLASFNYQLLMTAGLNPDGFGKYNWVRKGKQGAFEFDNFTAPAYTARLDWNGLPGLRMGFSAFFNPNSGKNTEKFLNYNNMNPINVFIYSFDAQYINKYVTARANVVHGHVSQTSEINGTSVSAGSPYGTRKRGMGSHALTYSAEVGVNIASFFPGTKLPNIYPYAHYDYYNPQETTVMGTVADPRTQVSMWACGLNWKPLPCLVVKADYATRQMGTHAVFGKGKYNSENEFRIGVAYALYFAKK